MYKGIWVAIGKTDPSSQILTPLNAPFLSNS